MDKESSSFQTSRFFFFVVSKIKNIKNKFFKNDALAPLKYVRDYRFTLTLFMSAIILCILNLFYVIIFSCIIYLVKILYLFFLPEFHYESRYNEECFLYWYIYICDQISHKKHQKNFFQIK